MTRIHPLVENQSSVLDHIAPQDLTAQEWQRLTSLFASYPQETEISLDRRSLISGILLGWCVISRQDFERYQSRNNQASSN